MVVKAQKHVMFSEPEVSLSRRPGDTVYGDMGGATWREEAQKTSYRV